MPIRQTITTAFLTLALLLALAACGENPANTDTVSLPPTASPEARTPDPAPDPTITPDSTAPDATDPPYVLADAAALEEFQGFGEAYPVDPQGINYKCFSLQPFCYDENGVVYFADYSDQCYLYSYQNGQSQLLAELPVYSLNYYDGFLYFLTNDTNINHHNQSNPGLLYKYNLQTNEITQLTDSMAEELRVTEDGIFYTKLRNDNRMSVYQYNEETGDETFIAPHHSYMRYGEYIVQFTSENQTIGFVNSDGEGFAWHTEEERAFESIHGRYYYYWPGDNDFKRMDLTNGEILTINTDEMRIANKYTVYQDVLYAVLYDSILHRYDEESGEWIAVSDEYQSLFCLFSGPDGLYGLKPFGRETAELAKLIYNEEDGLYYVVPLKG